MAKVHLSEVPHLQRVRHFFDEPQNYLDRMRCAIRVRSNTAKAFLAGRTFTRILDVGCGDGTISIPHLTTARHLTLLDLSSNMLSLAGSTVPSELAGNVRLVNADFVTRFKEDEPFDVVICMGLLAHVASPSDVIAKLASVLRPGGVLILEFTDAAHFVRRLLRLYRSVLEAFRPKVYRVNLLSRRHLLEIIRNHGFQVKAEFRYSFPLPGMHRIASQEVLYSFIKCGFGDAMHNRNRWLGSEHIVCLTRDEEPSECLCD